ncbi:MAG TPA: hypothetical protein VE078_04910 [Thermoanaerobaculia bacterium]|nr:hypothetical protein [Thermoanaerobaculia bacterium]
MSSNQIVVGQLQSDLEPIRTDLKSERVQFVLQDCQVRDQLAAFIVKLANCDHQRIRVDLTGSKVILTVQGKPGPAQLDELVQAALELGQAA